MKYDRYDIFDDKAAHYKGWLKESLVTYYDPRAHQSERDDPVEIDEREGSTFFS